MQIWVLGHRGMLGQAVTDLIRSTELPHALSDRDVDITDGRQVESFANDHRVTHIINCAAYTRVDACEQEESAARRVNGEGPANVARAVARRGAVAVHVSTDYVFDGHGKSPYTEDMPCAPLGAYGRSKWLGEQGFWQGLRDNPQARGYVVRTSWLFGHGGPNFVQTMLTLMRTKPKLRVVRDQVGRPTHTVDLARAVLRLCGALPGSPKVAPQGTYHFANTGSTSWHGFAEAILAEARAKGLPIVCEGVDGISTAEYPTPAMRPAYSVLSTEKVTTVLAEAPRPWHEALRAYIDRYASGPA